MSESDENQNPLLRTEKWTPQNGTVERCNRKMECDIPQITLSNNQYDLQYLDPEVQCGFTNCIRPPNWLQRLSTKRTFLLVFCLSMVLQGMFYTYFVSVLTTIEKLFQIQSKTAGVIMSATEIGQIAGGLLLSYYGGCGHRPRWIAGGMFLFGISASLGALPHFLFGDFVVKDFLASVPSEENPLKTANICKNPNSLLGDSFLDSLPNATFETLPFVIEPCDSPNSHTKIVLGILFVALLGVGVGQTAVFNLGFPYIDDNVGNEESPTYFGITMGVRILGPTFGFLLGSLCTRLPIDPFTKSKLDPSDPRWISAWWLGHILISFCIILTSFVMALFPKRLPQSPIRRPLRSPPKPLRRNPHLSKANSVESEAFEDMSPLTEESVSLESASFLKSAKFVPSSVDIMHDNGDLKHDNRVIIHNNGGINTYSKLNSSSIFEAPSISEEEDLKVKEFGRISRSSDNFNEQMQQRSIKDFVRVVSRLIKNKILVLRTLSSVLHMLPIAGLYTFLPKYIETQFRLPVHSAAMISGIGGILVMGFGIMISGMIIRRLSPPVRVIAGWIAITALLYSIGMIILMFLGCSHQDIQGRALHDVRWETSHFNPICERNCSTCNSDTFAPICSTEGKTYFSACHAGCKSVSQVNDTEELLFSDCECLGEHVTANLRLCESQCSNLLWYVLVFCIFVIIHSTSEVGGMLITLRCVSPKDKAMALGLISVAIGLFANVPCPIMYGAVIDYACIHWKKSCDGSGACQIYDPDIFRTFFHGTTSFTMFLAFIVDLCVWHCCKGLSLSEDKDKKDTSTNATSSIKSNPPSIQTMDRLETESTMSSSVSSQRKRESLDEEEDNDFLHEKSLEKNRGFETDQKPRVIKFSCEVSGYPLRESII